DWSSDVCSSDLLFGLEETIRTLVEEYFQPSAERLDVRKRLLLLMGPVSGGKSTIVSLLKRGLERYTRTDAGAVYGIKGCPMHEEPLHLIPESLRAEFYEEYGIHIEGTLCPVCRHRLDTEWEGDVGRVPVERILFSEERRVGIGTFAPSDPKSQDISELTGSIDFSTIATYGSESDPRAYRFDGELNIANRRMMEFQEMLKCDEKFLWNLLSLTQEGNFKAGRFALISADELVIAHTNEAEYRHFISNKKNEALHSRIIVINRKSTQPRSRRVYVNVLTGTLSTSPSRCSTSAPAPAPTPHSRSPTHTNKKKNNRNFAKTRKKVIVPPNIAVKTRSAPSLYPRLMA